MGATTDSATYEAVRGVLRAHTAYRRRGGARGGREIGITAKAERSAHDLGLLLDAHGKQLYEALVESPPAPLEQALATVAQLAEQDRRLAWNLDRFLRAVRQDNRFLHSAPTGEISSPRAADPGLFSAHVLEVCQRYRSVIDATTRTGRGRRDKKALRRRAEDVLCCNLCAFQLLVHSRRDAERAAQLVTAAVAGIR